MVNQVVVGIFRVLSLARKRKIQERWSSAVASGLNQRGPPKAIETKHGSDSEITLINGLSLGGVKKALLIGVN